MPADDGVPDTTAPALAGRVIIGASWAGNVAFLVTAVLAALGVTALEDAAIAVALALFFASLVVWVWALLVAIARTAQGDDVAVTTLFLLEGRVPGRARWLLYGSLAVCLAVTVATAAANPFGVLVPMYPLGLIGLWGARHGTFPPRRTGGPR
ncbi:MAG: hypothetical protein WDA60_13125 [Acidimicrobiia bacterium]|jgi:hypothetical protein